MVKVVNLQTLYRRTTRDRFQTISVLKLFPRQARHTTPAVCPAQIPYHTPPTLTILHGHMTFTLALLSNYIQLAQANQPASRLLRYLDRFESCSLKVMPNKNLYHSVAHTPSSKLVNLVCPSPSYTQRGPQNSLQQNRHIQTFVRAKHVDHTFALLPSSEEGLLVAWGRGIILGWPRLPT